MRSGLPCKFSSPYFIHKFKTLLLFTLISYVYEDHVVSPAPLISLLVATVYGISDVCWKGSSPKPLFFLMIVVPEQKYTVNSQSAGGWVVKTVTLPASQSWLLLPGASLSRPRVPLCFPNSNDTILNTQKIWIPRSRIFGSMGIFILVGIPECPTNPLVILSFFVLISWILLLIHSFRWSWILSFKWHFIEFVD